MIIGETFNQYEGYEDNYDYLFKKKPGRAPTPRQQKKADKPKQKPGRRLMQKLQDKKTSLIKKEKLILGNFGLFNKNKKNEQAAQATPDAAPQIDTDSSQDAGAVENTAQNQNPEMNTGTDNSAADNQDNTPAEPSPDNADSDPSESGYDETPAANKPESKTPEKAKDKKAGVGVWFGWACLGVTVVLIGYTVYRLDKMEANLPSNHDLHSNH